MSDHEWCRDVPRDEAVRAAEDAAAVPSIQHRDLPEVVAALTERVARLEAAQATIGSGDVFADVGCGSTGDEIARLTAERDAAIRERDAAREQNALLWQAIGLATTAVPSLVITADDPIGMMRRVAARVAELEAAAAPAANAGVDAKPVLWGVVWGHKDLPEDVDTRNTEEEALNLAKSDLNNGTVIPLYDAPQPPRGWLTSEEREAVDAAADAIGDRIDAYKEQDGDRRRIEVLDGLLARETPPKVRRPNPNVVITTVDARERIDRQWIAAIRAAGGEVEG